LTSGEFFNPVSLKARASWQAWNRSNFFGIGNGSLQPTAPAMIDALNDDTAIHTRYGQDVIHAELSGTVTAVGPLSFGAAVAYTERSFTDHAVVDEFEKTIAAYQASSLVGYLTGANNFYGEFSATIDTRAYVSRYISRAAPSSGWWATGWIGRNRGIQGDPSQYWRYGGDVHRYIDIYHGDRVLILRGYLEAVTAALDAIPFTDLPRIGGSEVLRGYEVDRFRDRAAADVSAEYDWPLHYGLTGYIFCDAGRVAHQVSDLDPSDLHYGYGGGIQIQSLTAFLVRAQVAHSTDGWFFRLALDPVADTRQKQRRL
ncbi:MAG TPA: BamA/TamA family outer membrane protein, partial [Kofleriaceae bacterium]